MLWLLCGGTALAIHAGAAALFFAGNKQRDSVPVGQKGVVVELSFEGAVAGGLAQAGNVSVQTEAPAQPVKEAAARKNEKVASVEVPALEKPEQAEPQPLPKPEKEAAPDKAVQPAPALIDDEILPVTEGEGVQDRVKVEEVANSVSGAGGTNMAASGIKDKGNGAQSGGLGGAIKSYEALVQVWVHKHLLYPKSARRRQLTGIVLVRFELGSKGELLSAKITQESPYKILNKSALKTVKRAVPFPAFPNTMKESHRVFVIPIEYKAG